MRGNNVTSTQPEVEVEIELALPSGERLKESKTEERFLADENGICVDVLLEETRPEEPLQVSDAKENGLCGNVLSSFVLVSVIFTSIRFVFMPELLVRLFGSPKYMCAPFVLYALVYHGILLVLMVLTDYSRCCVRMKRRTVKEGDQDGEDTLGKKDNNFRFSRTVVTRGLLAVGVLDTISSAIIVVMFLALYAFVFASDDGGGVDPGWNEEAVLVLAGISFYALSIILNFVMVSAITCPNTAWCRCLGAQQYIEIRHHEHENRIDAAKIGNNELSVTASYRSRHDCLIAVLVGVVLVCFGYQCSFLDDVRRRATGADGIVFRGCDDMVTHSCMLPFPSSSWLEEDSSTMTRKVVKIDPLSLPSIYKEGRGERFNADFLSGHYDGFSTISPILWHLPGFVDGDDDKAYGAVKQLPAATDVSASLDWSNSPSLLIKQDTAQLHPHFCQVDYLSPAKAMEGRICYCQPASNLDFNKTYIVVIRNLHSSEGNVLGSSTLYTSYRVAYEAGDATFRDDPRYLRFKNVIFPALESKGVALGEIQLAWDFHTVSYEDSARFVSSLYDLTMDKMNDAFGTSFNTDHKGTLSRLAARMEGGSVSADVADCKMSGVDYTDGAHDDMAARIYYRVKVPWLLTSRAYIDTALIHQLRDRGYGNSFQSNPRRMEIADQADISLEEVGILVQVPCSIAVGQRTVNRTVEWGHGIFSSREEGTLPDRGPIRANQRGWILWSAEWRGFDRHSFPMLARQLMHDGGKGITDVYNNVLQGFVSKIALGSFALPKILVNDHRKLQIPISDVMNLGSLPASFIGCSMGGILGTGYMYAAKIQRGAMYTAGAPFTYIVGTSSLFASFYLFLDLQFRSRVDARIAMTLWQIPFDEIESPLLAHNDTFSEILLLSARGDAVVTEASTMVLARTLQAPLITPSVVDSVEQLSNLSDASINALNNSLGIRGLFLASYPGDVSDLPTQGTPDATWGNNVHGCFPTDSETNAVASHFIEFGLLKNECGFSGCTPQNTADC